MVVPTPPAMPPIRICCRFARDRIDRKQFVAVMGGVEVGSPAQAVRAALEQPGAEAELDASVPHAADVGRDEVRQVGSGRHGHGEDQVVGLLVVPVDGAAEALVREPEIEAQVDGTGLFPPDVGIDRARPDRADELATELVLRLGIANRDRQCTADSWRMPGCRSRAHEPRSLRSDSPVRPCMNDSSESRHASATEGKVPHSLPGPKREDPSRRMLAARR